MHDLGIVVRHDRIVAAKVQFPLAEEGSSDQAWALAPGGPWTFRNRRGGTGGFRRDRTLSLAVDGEISSNVKSTTSCQTS